MKKILFLLALSVSAFSGEWKEFTVSEGCSISFPASPHHIKEKLRMNAKQEILYDAFIAAENTQQIYLMLIAEFPMAVTGKNVEISLRGFLAGMIQNNPSNKLVFAEFAEDKKMIVLEFFVESDGAFFRGRTFIQDKKLFLIALESSKETFHEDLYKEYIGTFNMR